MNAPTKLIDFETSPKIKLALLWTSVMFLYIYNDYFSMYTAGTIDAMAKGDLGPMGRATNPVLVGLSIMLAIPSLMICLSVLLAAGLNRWLNVACGSIYTVIEGLTFLGSPLFYQIFVAAEIILTGLIVCYALRWPSRRHETTIEP